LRGGLERAYQGGTDKTRKEAAMKFDMGQAWSEATAMMSANREVLLIVAGIFFFLPSLLTSLIGPDMNAMFNVTTPEQIEQMGDQITALYLDYWWLFTLATIAQMIGYISLLALLRDDARPTVGAAITTGITGLIPAVVTYILYVLGLSLVFGALIGLAAAAGITWLAGIIVVLAIPVVFYVSIKVSLAAPIIAIDKLYNPFAVLARSWRLTKGNSFRLLAFFILLLIVYMVISAVVGVVMMGLIAVAGDGAGRIIQGVIGGGLGAVATIVMVAVLASIHRQLSGPSTAAISETFE